MFFKFTQVNPFRFSPIFLKLGVYFVHNDIDPFHKWLPF